MAFPKLRFSKNKIKKAGKILVLAKPNVEELAWAQDVLVNWRACHGYPINTFQSTLRSRLNQIDKNAIVAQRLKRAPSIINKLKRFKKMQLSTMQDIGGLRAIVQSINKVKQVHKEYTRPGGFSHELVSIYDYIKNPKSDGYRCLHLVYRYRNKYHSVYDGLLVELQVRTRLQHAWATAVETMGIFLKQALKSSEGETKWLDYFKLVGAAFACIEKTPMIPQYEGLTQKTIFNEVKNAEKELKVLDKLATFSMLVNIIEKGQKKRKSSYHLIVLNHEDKTVTINPYGRDQLEKASQDYAEEEKNVLTNEQADVVLVSTGSIRSLKQAYPNYFLDTGEFIKKVRWIITNSSKK